MACQIYKWFRRDIPVPSDVCQDLINTLRERVKVSHILEAAEEATRFAQKMARVVGEIHKLQPAGDAKVDCWNGEMSEYAAEIEDMARYARMKHGGMVLLSAYKNNQLLYQQ
jgi:predicted DNA-binding protein (UPF0278 family)